MQPGYYWYKENGKAFPARWDGEHFHHENGKSDMDFDKVGKDHNGNPVVISYSCPVGCKCSSNPDGTVNVNCT